MKYFPLLFVLFILLESCGSKETSATQNSKEFDYYQFFEFDLTKYDIPASIMLPDETVGIGTSFIPEVKHKESDFLWEINIGPNFVFFIEDYGDMKDLVKNHKLKIADTKNEVFSVKFLTETPEMLVYERKLKESQSVNSQIPTYHIYAQKKINGVYYEFKNQESGNTKKVIEFLEKSFRSIQEKQSK